MGDGTDYGVRKPPDTNRRDFQPEVGRSNPITILDNFNSLSFQMQNKRISFTWGKWGGGLDHSIVEPLLSETKKKIE